MYLKNCAVISLVLLALLFVHSVISFSCYTCSSIQDKECLTNPVQDKFVTECSPTGIRARSINFQISGGNIIVNNSMGTIIMEDGKIFTSDGTTVDITVVSGDVSNINTVTMSSNTITHIYKNPASIRWVCAKMVAYDRNVGIKVVRACIPNYARCRGSRFCRCYSCKTELCNSAESPTLALGMFVVLGVVGIYSTM